MTIQNALQQKHMSIYRLTNASEMPYTTVNDICNDKVRLEKSSVETIYRLTHSC